MNETHTKRADVLQRLIHLSQMCLKCDQVVIGTKSPRRALVYRNTQTLGIKEFCVSLNRCYPGLDFSLLDGQ